VIARVDEVTFENSGWVVRVLTPSLTDRNHSNAPSIARHHTLAKEGALIVTGGDSVPVAISIVVAISVNALELVSTDNPPLRASSMETTAMEAATASLMEVTPFETSILSRSQVCAGCSEGG
jgi:hypothetical protein